MQVTTSLHVSSTLRLYSSSSLARHNRDDALFLLRGARNKTTQGAQHLFAHVLQITLHGEDLWLHTWSWFH